MSKRLAEDSNALDIRWLARTGYIPAVEGDIESGPVYWTRDRERGGKSGNAGTIYVRGYYSRLVLTYAWTPEGGPKRDIEQVISLARTAMPHGGTRLWALCPYCQRRAAVLYRGAQGGEPRFCCRRCAGVCYASQLEHGRTYKEEYDPWMGIGRTSWGRKIIAQVDAEMSQEHEQRLKELKKALAAQPKRPRGRPKTKRAYVRRSLVSKAADVLQPCCQSCGQPLPPPVRLAVPTCQIAVRA